MHYNNGMENFIRTYDNVLSDEGCNHLIELIDKQTITTNRIRGLEIKDRQMTIDPYFPTLAKEINEDVINNAFQYYCKDFPYLAQRGEWLSGSCLLQKTRPTEGFHNWHCENSGWQDAARWVAWMVYLNDVEEGGETEFLYQSLRIKPKKGTAVIWPGTFTHLHRGNSPLKGDKYILTGWYTLTAGINTFQLNVDQ
tara:strand:- start:911 stop:1498 length:588 start_codon:yes stop_codon:yes gene_type:complete